MIPRCLVWIRRGASRGTRQAGRRAAVRMCRLELQATAGPPKRQIAKALFLLAGLPARQLARPTASRLAGTPCSAFCPAPAFGVLAIWRYAIAVQTAIQPPKRGSGKVSLLCCAPLIRLRSFATFASAVAVAVLCARTGESIPNSEEPPDFGPEGGSQPHAESGRRSRERQWLAANGVSALASPCLGRRPWPPHRQDADAASCPTQRNRASLRSPCADS